MILLTILALTAIILLAAFIFVAAVGGASLAVIFGDLLIAVLAIACIIKWLWKRHYHRKVKNEENES